MSSKPTIRGPFVISLLFIAVVSLTAQVQSQQPIDPATNPSLVALGPKVHASLYLEKNGSVAWDLSWQALDPSWGNTTAFLVTPPPELQTNLKGRIFYFHQLGLNRDRKQFLNEAFELAQKGYVSMLINGYVPWQSSWTGTAVDVANIKKQMEEVKSAFSLLDHLSDLVAKPSYFVGHDYGAMIGALLVDEFPTTKFALLVPTPYFGDWISYTQPRVDIAQYNQLLGELHPAFSLAHASATRVLLQFAGSDLFVPEKKSKDLAGHSGQAKCETVPGSSHSDIFTKGKLQRWNWMFD